MVLFRYFLDRIASTPSKVNVERKINGIEVMGYEKFLDLLWSGELCE